jgi:hypothetical protein
MGLMFDTLSPELYAVADARFEDYKLRSEILVSLRIGSSAEHHPLQAADMMAYSSFRFHMENRYPNQTAPDFKVTPLIQRLVEKMGSQGALWDAVTLERIYRRRWE